MEKVLMKGNEAIAEAAVAAGCRHYFGYPITPQTEISEYLARRLPKMAGGVFVQAESEVSAINMVYGAAGAGARVMTSSSSPGMSLKLEGISYIAGAELPAVIVNIMRGGPGLGSIQPSQADYFQATKGGGHGDYHLVVLAPNSVQEMVDLTVLAFDIADRYSTPVMLLGDGALGQMMEPVVLPKPQTVRPAADWATTTRKARAGAAQNGVNSQFMKSEDLETHNIHLQDKYAEITSNEVRSESYLTDDAEVVIVAYGITSRIARSAIDKLRSQGYKIGMLRPISLWPFPYLEIEALIPTTKRFLVAELSAGQMIEDVLIAVGRERPVNLCGRMGGMMPSVSQMIEEIKSVYEAE